MNTNINRDIQALLDSLSSIENDLKVTPTVLLTGKQIIKNSSLSQQGDLINIYPDGVPTNQCHSTLLVVIGHNDNVELSILAAVEHIAVSCKGTTTNVIFWAVWWSSIAWSKHQASFKNIDVVLKPFYANQTLLNT